MRPLLLAILLLIFTNTTLLSQFSFVSSSPERNSVGVSVDHSIILEFSEALDPTTVPGCISVASNLRDEIPGDVSFQGSVITFQPDEEFYYGEVITVHVRQSLKSAGNTSLTIPVSLRFNTLIKNSLSAPPVFTDFESFRDPNNIMHASAPADLDDDGDIDIVYGGNSSIGWLENIGEANYNPHMIKEVAMFMYEMKVADIDRDGDQDILIATIPQGISLLLNDGNENFVLTVLSSTANSLSLDIADFDSNGFPDIVYSDITDVSKKTCILFNQGGNLFSSQVINTSGGIKNRIVDIDKDGDWDVVQHDYSAVKLLLNNGASFTTEVISSGRILDIAIADFDNDGNSEIASAEEGVLRLYVNDGSLHFNSQIIQNKYYDVIQAADLDGDNDVDLIVPDYSHFNMLVNDGSNNFNSVEIQNSHSSFSFDPASIEVADLDIDGDLDFFSVTSYFQIKCYTNAAFGEVYPFSSTSPNTKLYSESDSDWGDYDSDGDLDLLTTGTYQNGGATTLYDNQSGVLVEKPVQLPGLFLGSCDWGDYDKDGDLDILLTGAYFSSPNNRKNVSYIYTNDGGNFTFLMSSEVQLPKTYYGEARWADFNNDGWLDIVFNASGYSGIYQSDGKGNFSRKFDLPSVSQYGNVEVGDYDADGDLDLAVSGWRGNDDLGSLLKVFRNEGDWNFSETPGDYVGRIGGNLSWADMNNDGDLDLIVSGQIRFYGGGGVPSITVYDYNNSQFKAIENTEFLYQTDYDGTTSPGDYNNDGVPDIIASTQGGSSYSPDLSLLKNNGHGDLKTVDIELPNIVAQAANWVDYDLDHDLDIFVQNELLRNNSEVKNSPPTSPPSVHLDSVYNNSIYLSWNEGGDLETESLGLSYQIYLGTQSQTQNIVNSNSILANGNRKIAEVGNAKGRKARVDNLIGGSYYFGVQSIDASFEGSPFSSEEHAFVIRIKGGEGACKGLDYSYVAKPSGNYTWQVTGGTIVSGQGTDSLVVTWTTSGKGYVKVSDVQGFKNTLVVFVEEKPQPIISGAYTVCTGLSEYNVIDPLSYSTKWSVSGMNSVQEHHLNKGKINWSTPGQYNLIAKSYPKHEGCFSYDTLKVKVDRKPTALISGSGYTCTDHIEKYSTTSNNSTWRILNGSILVDSVQYIRVKWSSSLGDGKIFLDVKSDNDYCTSRDSLRITINQSPPKPTLTLFQDTIILSSPSPTNFYKWYNNATLVLSGQYNGLVSHVSGSFMVEVFNFAGCGTKSDPFQFFVTDIAQAENDEGNFSVYPNPADKKITIESVDGYIGDCEVSIYSILNSLVRRIDFHEANKTFFKEIDISDLEKGIYILKFKTRESQHSVKFLKK